MEVALGVGSLVLLVGGVCALVRRDIRPSQAATVLGIAVAVAAIALLATTLAPSFGSFYAFAVIAPTTLTGAVMAASVVGRPVRRGR